MTDEKSRYPVFLLGDMSSEEKSWLYLKTLYGMYEHLGDSSSLRYELRCITPAWKGGERKLRNLSYFPLTDDGYDAGVAYILRHRASWDIFNGILPKRDAEKSGRNLMGAAHNPYFAVWAVDVDGKGALYGSGNSGMAGAAENRLRSAEHIKRAIAAGLPRPHMAVQTRNGYHIYTFLQRVYSLEHEGGREMYQQNGHRLCEWISGKPDYETSEHKMEYSGAHADKQTFHAAGTLRPAGSFNHKTQEPCEVALVRHDMNASERHTRPHWTINLLPQPVDPATPDPDVTTQYDRNRVLGDWQRRPITYRTTEFLSQGAPPGCGTFHRMMVQAASDLSHCNFTINEAFGMIARACCDVAQIEETRTFLFPQHGNRTRYGDNRWNRHVVSQEDCLDQDVPAEEIIRWARGMS